MSREGTFGKDNQPAKKRGKGKRALLLDAIHRKLKKDHEEGEGVEVRDRAHAEELFADELIKQAYAQVRIGENTLFNEVTSRIYPKHKATNEPVYFEFPKDGTPVDKFNSIMLAVSEGKIAPDVGGTLVNMINSGVNIEDVTELKAKIEEIEKAMKADA